MCTFFALEMPGRCSLRWIIDVVVDNTNVLRIRSAFVKWWLFLELHSETEAPECTPDRLEVLDICRLPQAGLVASVTAG